MIGYRQVWVGGQRYYVTPFGQLPSVTTVIKETRPKAEVEKLEKWRREEPDADQITADSAQRGRELHAMVEAYLREGTMGTGRWWASVWPFLQNVDRTQETLIEVPVASPEGYAGSLDLMAVVDGVLTIVDWKTARKRKRREWIGDYLLQAAAYAGAVNFHRMPRGLPPVHDAVIVVAYEAALADTFYLNRSELVACYKAFVTRLEAFKRTHAAPTS